MTTGRCRLEWWANSVTLLLSFEIELNIGPDLAADGRLIGEGGEEFAELCELDPVFELRFDEGSAITVIVRPARDGRFAVTEYPGPQ